MKIENRKNEFFGLSENDLKIIRSKENPNLKYIGDIQEKVRRFVSFHNRNLYKVSKIRFKKDAVSQLENIFELLNFKVENSNLNKHLPNSLPIDPSILNAMLFCFDALKKYNSFKLKSFSKELNNYKKELNQFLEKEYQKEFLKGEIFNNDFIKIFNYEKFNLSKNKVNQGVVILSPNRYSLFSLSTIALCNKLQIPIKSIIVRRFSIKRFKNEFKRDGYLLLKKIYRKLILKSDENANKILISLKEICSKLTGGFSDIKKMANARKIPLIFVDEFEESNNFLLKNKADIALFTGGGFIKKSFLNNFKIGIINLHMGILPFYKGMDVVESPLSEGRFDFVGLTSHIMDAQIDTGPLIKIYKLNPFYYESLGSLRNEIGLIMPFLLVDSFLKLTSNEKVLNRQKLLGRQYYFLHRDLISIINEVLFKNYNHKELTEVNKFIFEISKKLGID